MIAIVDAQYTETRARTGCVIAHAWNAPAPAAERAIETEVAAAYVPGELYRRELPPVLEILRGVDDLTTVVIDAHVWLGPDRPGLGARLHDASAARSPSSPRTHSPVRRRCPSSATRRARCTSARSASIRTRPPPTSPPCTARIASRR